MDDPAQETIAIELYLGSQYWDRPGSVTIGIDQTTFYNDDIIGTYDSPTVVKFHATLDCGVDHQLWIARQGKSQDQCIPDPNGGMKDQMIRLLKVCIDGINVQNKVWHTSWFDPDYDPEWQAENLAQGIELEQHIIGETWWGHNGVWRLNFASPFYRYMINDFR